MSKIIRSIKAVDTSDGDGVKLKRVFGYYEKEVFDPFLLLDHAKTSYPQNGFPWHPHRGIETITYLIDGKAFHEDSLGNKGTLLKGDIQWMKAGSGILHQEFPDKESENFELLQFWLNMPQKEKMANPEYTYTNVLNDNIHSFGSSSLSVIAGTYRNISGPVQKEERKVKMLYVNLHKEDTFEIERISNTNAFIYVLDGNGKLEEENLSMYSVYKLDQGLINVTTSDTIKFIFAEGVPLKEPIRWYGPVVMNTDEEIRQVKQELRDGTFLKSHKMKSS